MWGILWVHDYFSPFAILSSPPHHHHPPILPSPPQEKIMDPELVRDVLLASEHFPDLAMHFSWLIRRWTHRGDTKGGHGDWGGAG